MRVELDGKFYSLPETDESKALLGELHAHHVSIDVLRYLLNAAESRELDLWDRIKEMSIKHTKGT